MNKTVSDIRRGNYLKRNRCSRKPILVNWSETKFEKIGAYFLAKVFCDGVYCKGIGRSKELAFDRLVDCVDIRLKTSLLIEVGNLVLGYRSGLGIDKYYKNGE